MVSKPRGNVDMKVLTIYLEPEVLKKFKVKAVMDGKSMTKIIQEMIKKYLAE